jgi:glutathione S-transferase
MSQAPILYTFRRCPYAMRARMGLVYAGIDFEIREVDLKHKPQEMLDASIKATVPVLIHEDLHIIDESIDILSWSISQNDPDCWNDFCEESKTRMASLVHENDHVFKEHLDHYKYSDRYLEQSQEVYREQGEIFLKNLESLLSESAFLFGESVSYADVAIFPFIRQFSNVDPVWFRSAPYPFLRTWLDHFLESKLFNSVMTKYDPWNVGDPVRHFFPLQG